MSALGRPQLGQGAIPGLFSLLQGLQAPADRCQQGPEVEAQGFVALGLESAQAFAQ